MPYLQIGYKRLHYTDYAPTNTAQPRETIILTHGLGSSQNYYAALLPLLTAHSYRCIVFDTTGAARSPHTFIAQSVPALAADIIGILDALAVPKALVVGHSMGAMVAAHLAATRSDRVVAAVLVGPVHPGPEVAAVFEKRVELVEREGMDAMASSVPQAATGKEASPLTKAWIREVLLAQDKWGYVSHCRVIAGAEPPAYGEVRVPVLVLQGEEDKSAPRERTDVIFGAIGSEEKRLEVLEGVGHWHCVEKPELVGAKILRFLEDIQ